MEKVRNTRIFIFDFLHSLLLKLQIEDTVTYNKMCEFPSALKNKRTT